MSRIAAAPQRFLPQTHQLLVAAGAYASTLENIRDQFDDELAQVVIVLDV